MHIQRQIKNNHRGFTLIELMIVVAIIATLATISLPYLTHTKKKGSNAAAVSDLRNFKTLMEADFNDKQSYPTFP